VSVVALSLFKTYTWQSQHPHRCGFHQIRFACQPIFEARESEICRSEREALESCNRSIEELHAVLDCKIVRISMRDSNLRGRSLPFLHVLSADGGCVIEMLLELADVTRNLLHRL